MSAVSQPAQHLVASWLARSCRDAAAVHRAWGDYALAEADDQLADALMETAERMRALDKRIAEHQEGVGS